MSQHIKTLIGNVLDKDFTSAKATFDALMSERLAVVMDEEEMKIAAKIYNDVDYDDLMAEAKKDDDSNGDSSSDDENDDEDDEDEEDEPKSKKKKMKEAALSELSKKTLASYTRKAANDVGNKGVEIGKKDADADEVDRMTNRHMPDKHKVRDNMKKALGADHETIGKIRRKAGTRLQGIDRATARLEK